MGRIVMLALTLAAAFAGGLISRYFSPETVHAQSQTAAPKEIRGQSFVLVNERGESYGFLGFGPDGRPVIKLLGEHGETIWSTGAIRLQLETR